MKTRWTWRKWVLLTALLVFGAASFLFALSPTHWLKRVDFGTVSVDGHRVDADIYFGEPEGEAEAIVLVHLKDGRDYFLDFGSEMMRQGDPSEYMRLFIGVWCFRPMKEGHFRAPLPFQNLNEFRIPTEDGHEVSVQF
jgi:hypothetical protein